MYPNTNEKCGVMVTTKCGTKRDACDSNLDIRISKNRSRLFSNAPYCVSGYIRCCSIKTDICPNPKCAIIDSRNDLAKLDRNEVNIEHIIRDYECRIAYEEHKALTGKDVRYYTENKMDKYNYIVVNHGGMLIKVPLNYTQFAYWRATVGPTFRDMSSIEKKEYKNEVDRMNCKISMLNEMKDPFWIGY